MILGVLWPNTSDGYLSGGIALKYILMIPIIPYIITGITLFFPIISLACFAAQRKVENICMKLNSATIALTRAFCASDYMDLYGAQIQQLLITVSTDCITELLYYRLLNYKIIVLLIIIILFFFDDCMF